MGFIPVGDAKLFSLAFGNPSAPHPILGIGGWVGSWELWAEPFAILSASYRTIVYDHRGVGATVAPLETITIERMVEDVFAVLDYYGIEHCTLAAESSGVQVALAAALRNQERISALILVDGMVSRDKIPENNRFLAGLRADYPATLAQFVDNCLPEPDSEHLRRWGRQITGRASQEAAIALLFASASINITPDLPRITQPALIIHGAADSIVPLASSEQLTQTLPNARLVVIQGAGHVPSVSYPVEVAHEIKSFLEGLP